ncbi:GNAT family N-acetyltransferase [Croceicoccus marinus]|jgi:ribosomal-protein-alanine N-acetyltransferase|uniref:GNAT family N-acetyltransferase n=1 Tax=Croceicoccus marinus TaxID=450378 RepID=A0A7G6VWG6_9SPHN|nr:GNAT family N-acetyltransferase [Croceicoccus marinus]QNE06081.1 GNAT family N-acetyltransferase [Croceicoccus marinus]
MAEQRIADAIMRVMDMAFDPVFGEAWTRSQLLGALVLPDTRCVLIDDAGNLAPPYLDRPDVDRPDLDRICGFALLRRVLDEEELLLIAISPESRGRGLGARLLDRAVETSRDLGCSKIFLEMRDDNPARHLYHARGFRPVGLRRDYYSGRDGKRRNAITFMRMINAP